jgi:hypothetical protein
VETVADKLGLVRIAPSAVLILREARPLRLLLPGSERIALCRQAPSDKALLDELAEDIANGAGFSLDEIHEFWRTDGGHARYGSKPFRLAPVETKGEILSRHFASGSLPDYLKALRSELNFLRDDEKPRLLVKATKVLVMREANDLRKWLSAEQLLSLCSRAPHADWLHDEIADLLAALPLAERRPEGSWQGVEGFLRYQSSLYKLAPPPVRREVICRHFNDFLGAVKGATEIPSFTWKWEASGVLEGLNDDDKRLAACWAGQQGYEDDGHTEARMLSARAAEKVAETFYRQFSLPVQDISITQLPGRGRTKEWKLYDLRAGQRPIDVKNARVPVNNPLTYVEHCVPRFKQARGQDVMIAAVVSPWIKKGQFHGSRLYPNTPPFRFIGEVDRKTPEQLKQSFAALTAQSSTTLIPVPTARDGSPHILPPWLFDYPDFVYR